MWPRLLGLGVVFGALSALLYWIGVPEAWAFGLSLLITTFGVVGLTLPREDLQNLSADNVEVLVDKKSSDDCTVVVKIVSGNFRAMINITNAPPESITAIERITADQWVKILKDVKSGKKTLKSKPAPIKQSKKLDYIAGLTVFTISSLIHPIVNMSLGFPRLNTLVGGFRDPAHR